MSVVPDGYGEATLVLQVAGGFSNPVMCVFGYQNQLGLDPLVAATQVGLAFSDPNRPLTAMISTWTFLEARITQNPGLESAVSVFGINGFTTGPAIPPQAAWLARKVTTTGGRPGRGRMYLPGLHENNVDDNGAINAGSVGTLQGYLNNFRNDLDASGVPMQVLHNNPAIPPSPVVQLILSPILATQRRRLR